MLNARAMTKSTVGRSWRCRQATHPSATAATVATSRRVPPLYIPFPRERARWLKGVLDSSAGKNGWSTIWCSVRAVCVTSSGRTTTRLGSARRHTNAGKRPPAEAGHDGRGGQERQRLEGHGEPEQPPGPGQTGRHRPAPPPAPPTARRPARRSPRGGPRRPRRSPRRRPPPATARAARRRRTATAAPPRRGRRARSRPGRVTTGTRHEPEHRVAVVHLGRPCAGPARARGP